MAQRSSRQGAPAQQPAAPRQNEYFVPRDGIDREVITADICRYLGNDALVRPGNYENPTTRQVTQGYYITAYRNLTTAMIEDLKADSSRWEQERRSQQAGPNRAGQPMHYRYSATYQNSRQEPRPNQDSEPRYPGTGYGNFQGVSGNTGPSYVPPGYGGYTQPPPPPPPPPFAAAPEGFGTTGPPVMSPGYSTANEPFVAGANYLTDFGSNPQGRDRNPPAVTGPTRMPQYSQGPPQPSFVPAASGAYYPPASNTGAFAPPAMQQQPQDPFFGRGSGYDRRASPSSGPSEYADAPSSFHPTPEQGYEDPQPPHSAGPASNQPAAMNTRAPRQPEAREPERHHQGVGHRHNGRR